MKNLAAALVSAQAEMPRVEPDATNPHYKTKFVSLDHLIAQTRPVLNRHGLALLQLPATNDGGLPVLRTVLLHGASGEQVSADAPLILGKNDMQGLGAAITYARRYAWAAALGISSELDDDGESSVGNRQASDPRNGRAAAESRPAPESGTARTGRSAEPTPSPDPAAKRGKNMISRPQHAKIAILVKELDEAASPIPSEFAGAESWVDVLRQRLQEEYGVGSRTELTSKQAGELIDWLDAQAIPFD